MHNKYREEFLFKMNLIFFNKANYINVLWMEI